MSSAHIFSIPIEGPSAEDLIQRISVATEPTWIVTANPEILLEAKRNSEYAKIIRSASVRTVDGFGLWAILRLKGVKTHRLTGVELAEHLLQYAVQHNLSVMLIGGGDGVAQKAAKGIQEAYPDIKIAWEQGGNVDQQGNDDLAGQATRSRIATTTPQIILVAFGHPKQEMWISRHLADFSYAKAVVGVGGTFDFWAETKKRAPRWMRTIGMEWLWRLIQEPKRWKRIWNAVVVFPFAAIFANKI